MKADLSNIGGLADEFGVLQAKIAEIAKKQKMIRDQIVATGQKAIEGKWFRVTVSDPFNKMTPDKELKEKIDELVKANLSAKYIKAHTKVSDDIITVRAFARLKEAA